MDRTWVARQFLGFTILLDVFSGFNSGNLNGKPKPFWGFPLVKRTSHPHGNQPGSMLLIESSYACLSLAVFSCEASVERVPLDHMALPGAWQATARCIPIYMMNCLGYQLRHFVPKFCIIIKYNSIACCLSLTFSDTNCLQWGVLSSLAAWNPG